MEEIVLAVMSSLLHCSLCWRIRSLVPLQFKQERCVPRNTGGEREACAPLEGANKRQRTMDTTGGLVSSSGGVVKVASCYSLGGGTLFA